MPTKKKSILPEGFEPDNELPEGFEPDTVLPKGFEPDETETKPGLLKKAYDWATAPLTDAPSRFAKSVGEYINPASSEGGYWSGLGQGLIQGVGDVASSFTSPIELAMTLTGAGAVSAAKRGLQGANALRRATQGLSAVELAHGGSAVFDRDSTLAERGMGLAEMAGGAAGMHFPMPKPGMPNIKPSINGLAPEGLISPEPALTGDAANITNFLGIDPSLVDKSVSPPKATKATGGLAKDLQGAKPRFNFGKETYEPNFEDDLDKALYILAQESPSKRNADYLKFAMDETGLDEAGVLKHAYNARKRIKSLVKGQPSGIVDIPSGGVIDSIRQPRSLSPEMPTEAVDLAAPKHTPQIPFEGSTPNHLFDEFISSDGDEVYGKGFGRYDETGTEIKPVIDIQAEPNKPFVNPFAKQIPETITPEAPVAAPNPYSAKFAYWQEGYPDVGIEDMPYWHAQGGEPGGYGGSHIGLERMKELGIDPGDYPPNPRIARELAEQQTVDLETPVGNKPAIKANLDGSFTDTATGQILDKSGRPLDNNLRMTGEVAPVDVDSDLVNPFARSNEAIPEFDTFSKFRNEGSRQFSGDETIDLAHDVGRPLYDVPEVIGDSNKPQSNLVGLKREANVLAENLEGMPAGRATTIKMQKQLDSLVEDITRIEGDSPIPPNLAADPNMYGGLFGIGGKGGGSKRLPPREGPVGAVVDKLMGSLQASKGLRTKQDKMLSKERAQRFAAFDKESQTGQAGAASALSKLKGEYSKVNRSPLQLEDTDVDMLFTAIKDARITSFEKAQGYTALFKILEGGKVPQRNELALLDNVFGRGFGDQIVEMHGGIGLVGLKLAKTANTMKALMSSIDISGPMRQGFGLIHKDEWRSAFVEMFKYLGDKKYYEAAMDEIQARPTYLLGRESGLFIADPKSLMKGEEAFMNNYIGNVPGISKLVDASERAYVGFLNKLRADTFDSLIKNAQRSGNKAFEIVDDVVVPTDVARNISNFINNATGRGTLGSLEKMAPELNMVLWSPRLLSSRLNTLNPMTYLDPNIDNFTRKESIKSLLAMASAGSLMVGMGAAAGGSVSGDPTSSDFGKVRFGDTVLDPWAGYQQPIVAAARFLNGIRKGEPVEGTKAVGRFMTNKLSPMASLGYEIGTAKSLSKTGEMEDQYGNKTSVQKETLERFVPMFVQGLTEVLSENPDFAEGVKDLAAGKGDMGNLGYAIPSVVGVGVQNYPEPGKKNRGMSVKQSGIGRLAP